MKRILMDIEGNGADQRPRRKLTFRVGRKAPPPLSDAKIDHAGITANPLQPPQNGPSNKAP